MFERTPAYMIRLSVFITLICLCFFACDNNSVKKFEFYYYPARNVYYDVANAQFVYSVNGGKTWQAFKKELGKDPATLGSRTVIHSTSQHPWYNNAEDVQQYNGKLFSIADEDTMAQPEVSDKKIIKKTNPATTEPKKEKKPGFFKRLFGKKK